MSILSNIKSILSKPPLPSESTKQMQSKKTILIVEDEKPLADALELKLQENGFNTLKAENGQVGLDTILQKKPDAVILDLMMPIMNGKSMLAKLREYPEFKKLPVLILTNAGDEENIKETKLYLDALDFIIKSNVNLDEIIFKLKSLFNTLYQ